MSGAGVTADAVVVGAGVFGLAGARELRRRGLRVTLLDPGPLPHPLAASTDVSKVVRMEYGADVAYMALVERALEGWRRWNREATLGEPLFHETGVLMVTRQAMAPGGFEHDSHHTLLARGHRPERLDAATLVRRFPAWRPGSHVDGFFHARGGWAESGRVIAALADLAEREGVDLRVGESAVELVTAGDRVTGVRTASGATHSAARVVIAAGAWTPRLVPELRAAMRISGHPVFHLRPAAPERFTGDGFPVFTADIARTGWYGFPLHPREGIVKIGNHGAGQELDPSRDARVVGPEEVDRLRAFLAATFPGLVDAELVATRRCLYTDTRDGHLWIDRHPERPGLVVASGGSGHAFKLAPVLGELVADAALGAAGEATLIVGDRFRWRSFGDDARGEEAARCHD